MVCVLNICCGCKGKNESTSRLEVANTIDMQMKNTIKNINNIVNETVNSVSTQLVNSVSAGISISQGSYNTANLGNMVIGKKAQVDINQMTEVVAQAVAIAKITSDAESLEKLTSEISAALESKASNNNDLQMAMQSLNAIKEIKEKAGGPEGMVDSVMGALKGVMGSGGSSEEKSKVFKNKIGMTVENETLFENNISNIIRNQVSGKITNETFGSIDLDAAAANVINANSISIDDEGVLSLTQKATLESFMQAMLDLKIGSGISSEILNENDTNAISEAMNKNKADAELTSSNESEDIQKDGSAIMDTLNNLNPLNLLKDLGKYGAIIVVVIIILIIGFVFVFMILPKMSKSPKFAPLNVQAPVPS